MFLRHNGFTYKNATEQGTRMKREAIAIPCFRLKKGHTPKTKCLKRAQVDLDRLVKWLM